MLLDRLPSITLLSSRALEHFELRKLRKEVKILQEERDLLKRAAAFFVREADPRGRE
jgi:hypothetical protein